MGVVLPWARLPPNGRGPSVGVSADLGVVPQDGLRREESLMSLLTPALFQVGRGDPPQTPVCNLNLALPDNIQPEPAPSEPDLLALEKKYSFLSISE